MSSTQCQGHSEVVGCIVARVPMWQSIEPRGWLCACCKETIDNRVSLGAFRSLRHEIHKHTRAWDEVCKNRLRTSKSTKHVTSSDCAKHLWGHILRLLWLSRFLQPRECFVSNWSTLQPHSNVNAKLYNLLAYSDRWEITRPVWLLVWAICVPIFSLAGKHIFKTLIVVHACSFFFVYIYHTLSHIFYLQLTW